MAQSKIDSKEQNVSSTEAQEEHLIGVITDAVRRRGFSKLVFTIRVTDRAITLVPEPGAGEKVKEPANRIEMSQIKSVSLTLGRSYKNCCGNLQEESGSLEIVTAGAKYSFSLPPTRAEKAQGILRSAKLIK